MSHSEFSEDDAIFMRRALELAAYASSLNEIPVGRSWSVTTQLLVRAGMRRFQIMMRVIMQRSQRFATPAMWIRITGFQTPRYM